MLPNVQNSTDDYPRICARAHHLILILPLRSFRHWQKWLDFRYNTLSGLFCYYYQNCLPSLLSRHEAELCNRYGENIINRGGTCHVKLQKRRSNNEGSLRQYLQDAHVCVLFVLPRLTQPHVVAYAPFLCHDWLGAHLIVIGVNSCQVNLHLLMFSYTMTHPHSNYGCRDDSFGHVVPSLRLR